MTIVLQGVRSLVMPVDKKGRPVKTLAPAKSGEDDDVMPFKTSSFTPQSATDGNSVATQLEAVKSMDPDLDGTGQLVCVIDTGISFIGNPAYGECKALNTPKGKCKVVTGYDFVGDSFTGLQTGPSAVRGGMPVRDQIIVRKLGSSQQKRDMPTNTVAACHPTLVDVDSRHYSAPYD